MAIFIKNYSEVVPLGYDFSGEMSSSESITLSNSSITVYDSSGNDVTATILKPNSINVTDNTLLGVFQGGTIGEVYTIKFFAYIDADKQLIGKGIMSVNGD